MFVLNNIQRIEDIERNVVEQHVIMFLFIKPSDNLSKEIINQFNYYHHLSDKYCSIYAAGFMEDPYTLDYPDRVEIPSIDNTKWWYSDKCFIEVSPSHKNGQCFAPESERNHRITHDS